MQPFFLYFEDKNNSVFQAILEFKCNHHYFDILKLKTSQSLQKKFKFQYNHFFLVGGYFCEKYS